MNIFYALSSVSATTTGDFSTCSGSAALAAAAQVARFFCRNLMTFLRTCSRRASWRCSSVAYFRGRPMGRRWHYSASRNAEVEEEEEEEDEKQRVSCLVGFVFV